MSAIKNAFSFFTVGKEDYDEPQAPLAAARNTSNVSRMPSMLNSFRKSSDSSAINSVSVTSYDEFAPLISDTLLNRISLVVDVAPLNATDRRRITDFMFGLTAGIQGSMVRINSTVFIITPSGTPVNDAEGADDINQMGNFDDDSLIMSPLA